MNFSILHDSLLVGMHIFENGKIVELKFQKESNQYTIKLYGLILFKADNFREGNVVLDVVLKTGESVPESELASVLKERCEDKNSPFFRKILDGVLEQQYSIFYLNPSFGGTISAICSQAELL